MKKTKISEGANVKVIVRKHKRYGQTGIVQSIAPRVSYVRVAFGDKSWDTWSFEVKDLKILEDDF